MKKLIKKLGFTSLFVALALIVLQSCNRTTDSCNCPDQIIGEYYKAIAADKPGVFTSYIQNWENMEESEQEMILSANEEFARNFSTGGGIKEIQITRITVPVNIILNNDDTIRHRQLMVWVDGEWMIRP